jgi:hypothetical protein
MAQFDRSSALAAARRILEQGGWCVYEARPAAPASHWEARAVLFDLVPEAAVAALEDEIAVEPEHDARLTGCDRRTLAPAPGMGAHPCYVAG